MVPTIRPLVDAASTQVRIARKSLRGKGSPLASRSTARAKEHAVFDTRTYPA